MLILLETDDKTFVDAVRDVALTCVDEVSIQTGFPSLVALDDSNVILYGEDLFEGMDTAQYRILHYELAKLGGVFFTNRPFDIKLDGSPSPMYAGSILDPKKIVDSAIYAQARAEKFKDLKVNYIGRTFVDPKNVIVMDNKSQDKNWDIISNLMAVAPENWWDSVAFVSTSNVDYLDSLFNDTLYYSQAVALTPAAGAKLRHVGVDFVDISDIPFTERGGRLIREATRRNGSMSITMD